MPARLRRGLFGAAGLTALGLLLAAAGGGFSPAGKAGLAHQEDVATPVSLGISKPAPAPAQRIVIQPSRNLAALMDAAGEARDAARRILKLIPR